MDKEQLLEEIGKRAPWYQRIEFPEHGVSTTDNPEWAVYDGSPDNMLDGLSAEDAARYRPQPKWKYLKEIIPSVKGQEVLEVGCANGFFSSEFAKMGASHVYGLDYGNWINNAEFVKEVFNLDNVTLIRNDFFHMGFENSPIPHERNPENVSGWLPTVDMVFLSTAFVHFHYPFMALHKLTKLPRKYLILDEGFMGGQGGGGESSASFFWRQGRGSHAFSLTIRCIVKYLWRVGIAPSNVHLNFYPKDNPHRCCFVVDVGAPQDITTDEDIKKWRD